MKFNYIPLIIFTLCEFSLSANAQNYTAYSTGSIADLVSNPEGGICLMGGASEHDEAMRWFLRRADGGDVLVLRASGSDGYNAYMYSQLGVTIHSVTTIVCHNAAASLDSFVLNKIATAEAIWFAGGDQWDYVDYWRGTAVDSLINLAIKNRNIVIGGTSAGMAIQGGYYFSAQNGTVSSTTALANPYASSMTVDSMSFIDNKYLENVITDTHYDNPDRRGRHSAFLARILSDYGVAAKGIACEEYTAVCIDTSGIARVYGDYPNYDEQAFFIQSNCQLTDPSPEQCSPGQPLNWYRDSVALKVCAIHGTPMGLNTFDLNDWSTQSGGQWQHWFIQNGAYQALSGDSIDCSTITSDDEIEAAPIEIFPNPVFDKLQIRLPLALGATAIQLYHISGRLLRTYPVNENSDFEIPMLDAAAGTYFIVLYKNQTILARKMLIKVSY